MKRKRGREEGREDGSKKREDARKGREDMRKKRDDARKRGLGRWDQQWLTEHGLTIHRRSNPKTPVFYGTLI